MPFLSIIHYHPPAAQPDPIAVVHAHMARSDFRPLNFLVCADGLEVLARGLVAAYNYFCAYVAETDPQVASSVLSEIPRPLQLRRVMFII